MSAKPYNPNCIVYKVDPQALKDGVSVEQLKKGMGRKVPLSYDAQFSPHAWRAQNFTKLEDIEGVEND